MGRIFRRSGQLIEKADNVLKIRPYQVYYLSSVGTDLIRLIQGLGYDIPVESYLNFLINNWQKYSLNVIIQSYSQTDYTLNIIGTVSQGLNPIESLELQVSTLRGVINE